MGAHSGPMLLAAHAVQLAAALPAIWYASELTEFDGLAEDHWEGLKLSNGVLHHGDAPGCGVTPKPGSPQASTMHQGGGKSRPKGGKA